jgi:hypothetical protein
MNTSDLIAKYATLVASPLRDALSGYVTDNVYQVLKNTHTNMKYTPFPAAEWQSWDNLCLDKKDKEGGQKIFADAPAKTQKYVRDATTGKNVRVEGEFEEKKKRLRKITTFNAAGKEALTMIITAFVHEAELVSGENHRNDAEIKSAIIENAAKYEYQISLLLFTICDKYNDDVVKDMFVATHGNAKAKLDGAIDKVVKNSKVKDVVVDTIMRFLQIFTIDLASNLWWETKEAVVDEDLCGKGSTTSDKQVKQFLHRESNMHLSQDEKLGFAFYDALKSFHEGITVYDNERKAEFKEKRKTTAAAADAKKAVLDATADAPVAEAASAPATPDAAPVAAKAAPAAKAEAAKAAPAAKAEAAKAEAAKPVEAAAPAKAEATRTRRRAPQ